MQRKLGPFKASQKGIFLSCSSISCWFARMHQYTKSIDLLVEASMSFCTVRLIHCEKYFGKKKPLVQGVHSQLTWYAITWICNYIKRSHLGRCINFNVYFFSLTDYRRDLEPILGILRTLHTHSYKTIGMFLVGGRKLENSAEEHAQTETPAQDQIPGPWSCYTTTRHS